MVLIDNIYLRRDLIVQCCGYFLIDLILLYLKNMFVLSFSEILLKHK